MKFGDLLRDGKERVIIDEVQREPEILSWVQVFVDTQKETGLFILTGSNQPALGEAISQSLAGRTSIHHFLPLSLEVLASSDLLGSRDDMLLKGFLPGLYDVAMTPG